MRVSIVNLSPDQIAAPASNLRPWRIRQRSRARDGRGIRHRSDSDSSRPRICQCIPELELLTVLSRGNFFEQVIRRIEHRSLQAKPLNDLPIGKPVETLAAQALKDKTEKYIVQVTVDDFHARLDIWFA